MGRESVVIAGHMFESFPDSEGIKTDNLQRSTHIYRFESFPDSEGIKTPGIRPACRTSLFESFPDSEGIKTIANGCNSIFCSGLNPSLIQKGLRLVAGYVVSLDHVFESFPDSEGIKTRQACRTS